MTTTAALLIGNQCYTMKYHAQQEGERQRIKHACLTLMERLGVHEARVTYDITSGNIVPITRDQEKEPQS
jgi:hypothetical protein